jgi:hypothetical protein
MTYTLPTIHLNGTGRDTLREEYHHAYKSVCAASDAFCDSTFNARDFYPQGPAAFSQARAERDAVLDHFGAIKQYLEAHLLHLTA